MVCDTGLCADDVTAQQRCNDLVTAAARTRADARGPDTETTIYLRTSTLLYRCEQFGIGRITLQFRWRADAVSLAEFMSGVEEYTAADERARASTSIYDSVTSTATPPEQRSGGCNDTANDVFAAPYSFSVVGTRLGAIPQSANDAYVAAVQAAENANCVEDEPDGPTGPATNCTGRQPDQCSTCVSSTDPFTGTIIFEWQRCPPGQFCFPFEIFGQPQFACRPARCGANERRNAIGNCVAIGTPPPADCEGDAPSVCHTCVEGSWVARPNSEVCGGQCLTLCPTGQVRSTTTCLCGFPPCPDNETRNAANVCVCDEGYARNADGDCEEETGPTLPPCPSNEERNTAGDCVCVSGFERNDAGACVEPPPPPVECPSGTEETDCGDGTERCLRPCTSPCTSRTGCGPCVTSRQSPDPAGMLWISERCTYIDACTQNRDGTPNGNFIVTAAMLAGCTTPVGNRAAVGRCLRAGVDPCGAAGVVVVPPPIAGPCQSVEGDGTDARPYRIVNDCDEGENCVNGVCTPIAQCPPGTVFNASVGGCVTPPTPQQPMPPTTTPIRPTCPEGTVLNAATGNCDQPTVEQLPCPKYDFSADPRTDEGRAAIAEWIEAAPQSKLVHTTTRCSVDPEQVVTRVPDRTALREQALTLNAPGVAASLPTFAESAARWLAASERTRS